MQEGIHSTSRSSAVMPTFRQEAPTGRRVSKPTTSKPPRTQGFTLVELLVVIAIVGTWWRCCCRRCRLRARPPAACRARNNLKQIALAMHNHEVHVSLPALLEARLVAAAELGPGPAAVPGAGQPGQRRALRPDAELVAEHDVRLAARCHSQRGHGEDSSERVHLPVDARPEAVCRTRARSHRAEQDRSVRRLLRAGRREPGHQ